MDVFGTYFTNAQACDYIRVQSALQWTASVHTLHMPKPVISSCSKCFALDCFGPYFTHAQTCDYVRVHSATQWTSSAHTLRMPKPVITFVFKVLRNGLLLVSVYTFRNLEKPRNVGGNGELSLSKYTKWSHQMEPRRLKQTQNGAKQSIPSTPGGENKPKTEPNEVYQVYQMEPPETKTRLKQSQASLYVDFCPFAHF